MPDLRRFRRRAHHPRNDRPRIEYRGFVVASPHWWMRFGLISKAIMGKLRLVSAGAAGADVFVRLVDRFPIDAACDRSAA